MKKIVLSLILSFALFSCDDSEPVTLHNDNYLIFGHFYGMCFGEGCVETFKLTETALFEDTIDDYTGQNLQFVSLSNDQFELVKDLFRFFPNALLQEKETVIGCPDCADGGGLLIQYKSNGIVRSWRIDQNKNNVPAYLHTFMDKMNEKIALLAN